MNGKYLSRLSDAGAKELLEDLLSKLEKDEYLVDKDEGEHWTDYIGIEVDMTDVRGTLNALIDAMDELNQDDFFGTEGWEHRYDV